MKKTVKEIARLINGKVIGDANLLVSGITNISQPKKGCVTFIEHHRYLAEAEKSDIACILVPEKITASSKTIIVVKNPKLSFTRLARLFFPRRTFSGGISPQASIAKTAKIARGVTIEDFAVIGEEVEIGENTAIRSFVYIDKHAVIGENTVIHPHVMIYDNCQIGSNVIIHSSTVVGSDGFGYIRDEDGVQVKVPQMGNVIIEDDVEIGSNVSIDRATFGSTILRKGVKIDNLVQIAHNVLVGENTAISGSAGIAGSAKIGKNCTLAAQVGVGDHCVIEDNVIIAGKSGVPSKKTVPANQIFMGAPARPIQMYKRQQGMLAKLPLMLEEIKKLKQKNANNDS